MKGRMSERKGQVKDFPTKQMPWIVEMSDEDGGERKKRKASSPRPHPPGARQNVNAGSVAERSS